jgi:hypothetical protein
VSAEKCGGCYTKTDCKNNTIVTDSHYLKTNSPHGRRPFMDPNGSSMCSLELVTGPHAEPDESNIEQYAAFLISNLILYSRVSHPLGDSS